MTTQQRELVYWNIDRFIASNEAIESHFLSLEKYHDRITKSLRRYDFQLEGYRLDGDKIFVNKGNEVEFNEVDEGKGFVICLHLLGYLFDRQLVDNDSFRHYLHPVLFAELEKCFGYWYYS